MAVLWVLIGALLVALLWTFGAQNSRAVDLSYFGYYLSGTPMWMVVVIPAVIGLLLGLLLATPGRVRQSLANRRLRGQLQDRERTIAQLQGRVGELERTTSPASPASPAALRGETGTLPEVPDVSTGSRLSA
jgi:uncharacterized integral membrane protein